MRKLLAALLAVPVLVLVYAAVVVRRSVVARAGVAIGLSAALGIVTFGVVTPEGSTARPPAPVRQLTTATFTALVRTDQAPRGPVAIDFSGSMDAPSVAAALTVDPPIPVALAWSVDRTRLLVRPATAWRSSVLYTITVGTGARDASGSPLGAPVRASFLARGATTGTLAAIGARGSSVRPDAAFVFTFDRPVDVASVRAALDVEPPLEGTVTAAGGEPASATVSFVPSAPLAPGTTYRVGLAGSVVDVDGGTVQAAPLVVSVPAAPTVVRFRPFSKTTSVPVDAAVSVRFTRPMDRASTASAFSVTAGGRRVTGRTSWAEGDTVLVFVPAKPFGRGIGVVAAIAGTARSADGVPVAAASRSTFTTEKPAPPPAARKPPTKATAKPSVKATAKPATKPIPRPATVAGDWHAVEVYYLSLMNCTRTGGWVTSSGDCSSPGGRDVAPLRLDAGISDRVSRPYARYMLSLGVCSHFVDGNPGDRLRRAGYDSYRWAENIGCQSGDPYRSVLNTHLFYQSEKSYGGGHYVNLMNPAYDRVGIGIWVSGGRLRLVIDFYHP